MERFNLKKLNEGESKEQYRVEVSNRIAALKDLNVEVGINSVRKPIGEHTKFSQKESRLFGIEEA
jgi:hypothetical protein